MPLSFSALTISEAHKGHTHNSVCLERKNSQKRTSTTQNGKNASCKLILNFPFLPLDQATTLLVSLGWNPYIYLNSLRVPSLAVTVDRTLGLVQKYHLPLLCLEMRKIATASCPLLLYSLSQRKSSCLLPRICDLTSHHQSWFVLLLAYHARWWA